MNDSTQTSEKKPYVFSRTTLMIIWILWLPFGLMVVYADTNFFTTSMTSSTFYYMLLTVGSLAASTTFLLYLIRKREADADQ